MNDHSEINDLLPLYAAGNLAEGERRRIERHLAQCPACAADLELWMAVSAEVGTANREIRVPHNLADQTLRRIRRGNGLADGFRWLWSLIRVQTLLIRGEMWPVAAIVMAMGCVMGYLAGNPLVVKWLAPLVAAASLASIHSSDSDPGIELALAAPTSQWQILLTRMLLVFVYDLGLAVAASLILTPILPEWSSAGLIMTWLAPMTFLSALALTLSMWIGTANAITLAYLGWLGQLGATGLPIKYSLAPIVQRVFGAYAEFWTHSNVLWVLAVVLVLVACWKAGRNDLRLPNWA